MVPLESAELGHIGGFQRPLRAMLGTIILAALHVPLAAAGPVSQDVPVPGGTAAFARALGIDPTPDRGRFMAELSRLAYDAEGRNPTAAAFLQTLRQAFLKGQHPSIKSDGPPELVPVPLTVDVWGTAIFRRRVAPDELVMSIVADRQAALICHGLASLDDETLQFFVDHASVLTRLYERAAPIFAVFSSNLSVRGNRVVPAGGPDAVPLWEAVVGEKVTRPDRFVLALFELNEGRLAYLYDIAGSLDPARRAFLLGSWRSDPAARLDRFRELATAGVNAFKDWHVRTMPYGRSPWDLAMTFIRLGVTETGAPAPPASRAFWSRAVASGDLPDETATAKAFDDTPIDAAWLASFIGDSDVRQRIERLDQIGFAQRLFGEVAAADANATLVAVRAVPHYRMLVLGLERIGVRSPSVYAAAARHAHRLAAVDGIRGFVAQAQFQGSLALVGRMVSVRTIDVAQAETLIDRLAAKPFNEEGRYAGAIARWLQDDLRAVIPISKNDVDDGVDLESLLIGALSGRASGATGHVAVIWEGQQYRLDFGFAERRRLLRVREKQGGLRLDVPIEIAAIARGLSDPNGSLDIPAAIAQLTKLLPDLPRHAGSDVGAGAPIALSGALDGREVARKIIDELTKIERRKDVKREARLGGPLTELADELLGQVLLSFAYAMNVGDPEGAALLAGDISYRHDFGFNIKDGAMRARASWSVPRQEIAPNVPWHVNGSLIGLDIGLASLALRRMNFDHLTGAPKLTSNERDSFTVSVSLLNPYALRDEDRDRIVEGIARGKARVLALATNAGAFDALADDIGMGGARRRASRWTLAHDPDRLLTMFSLSEVLYLGLPAAPGTNRATFGFGPTLDPWGMTSLATAGCVCSRLAPPGQWWLVVGRPQLGVVASAIADLNLYIAARLKEMQMPAALTKTVLAAAMQDFIDEVRPTDAADWLTLSRSAQTATREQIEDYLSAATADGPLVPDNTRTTPRR